MGTAPIPTFPLTAWEQAAIVCLFVVFVLFLMWLLLRYMLSHFSKIIDSVETLVDKFLMATENRDKRFVDSLDKRDELYEIRNAPTLVEIKALQVKVDILNNTLTDHDAKTDQALADMRIARQKRSKSETVPRPETQ
jgi:uncharacterized membrane protein YvbJ